MRFRCSQVRSNAVGNLVPCAHKRCRCLAEVENQFCSPAAVKDKPLSQCPCGHPECAGSEEAVGGGDEDEYEMPVEC